MSSSISEGSGVKVVGTHTGLHGKTGWVKKIGTASGNPNFAVVVIDDDDGDGSMFDNGIYWLRIKDLVEQ